MHNVEITFNYEIRHFSNVQWDVNAAGSDIEDTDSEGGWFSKLFGGRMLTTARAEVTGGTGDILEELEKVMVSSIWDELLSDPDMMFNNSTNECEGLVVSEVDEGSVNDAANTELIPTSESRLLGLSVYPVDEVNPDGMWGRPGFLFIRVNDL